MDSVLVFLLAACAVLVPFLIAIGRRIDLGAAIAVMALPVLLPVVGWFAALLIALMARPER